MHKMRITKKRRIDTTRVLLLYFVKWIFIRFSLCIPSANLIPNLNSNPLQLYFPSFPMWIDFHPTNFSIKFEISPLLKHICTAKNIKLQSLITITNCKYILSFLHRLRNVPGIRLNTMKYILIYHNTISSWYGVNDKI